MGQGDTECRQQLDRKDIKREDESNGEGFRDASDGKVDPDVSPTENAE